MTEPENMCTSWELSFKQRTLKVGERRLGLKFLTLNNHKVLSVPHLKGPVLPSQCYYCEEAPVDSLTVVF